MSTAEKITITVEELQQDFEMARLKRLIKRAEKDLQNGDLLAALDTLKEVNQPINSALLLVK